MWAKALRNIGKIDVALKKVEEAIQIYSSDKEAMQVGENVLTGICALKNKQTQNKLTLDYLIYNEYYY